MKNSAETIRKMVSYLNNPQRDGGFWLPNIQRSFVWKKEQILGLFDSIMREYPIGTLLVWKTRDELKIKRFIDIYEQNSRLPIDHYIIKNDDIKMLVLDGQQRLQSLFIGLKGSYNGQELHFNILSGKKTSKPDDETIYKFDFLSSENADPKWIPFKELVFNDENVMRISNNIIRSFVESPSIDEQEIIQENIAQISNLFKDREIIVYQEIDSVDKPHLYMQDDVVEIFIRANSGGTPLSKSDLLFSLLTSTMEH